MAHINANLPLMKHFFLFGMNFVAIERKQIARDIAELILRELRCIHIVGQFIGGNRLGKILKGIHVAADSPRPEIGEHRRHHTQHNHGNPYHRVDAQKIKHLPFIRQCRKRPDMTVITHP